MTGKYAFIESEEGNYPIARMCQWAKVSRSGYYNWRDRPQSATAARREILVAQVKFAFEHSDGTYGYRRIHAQLARWDTCVDPGTVRSIMRELGLVACQPRRSGQSRPSPATRTHCQTSWPATSALTARA